LSSFKVLFLCWTKDLFEKHRQFLIMSNPEQNVNEVHQTPQAQNDDAYVFLEQGFLVL